MDKEEVDALGFLSLNDFSKWLLVQGRFCLATSITVVVWVASGCPIQGPNPTLTSLLYLNCSTVSPHCSSPAVTRCTYWIITFGFFFLHIFILSPKMLRQPNVFWVTSQIPNHSNVWSELSLLAYALFSVFARKGRLQHYSRLGFTRFCH